jgi:hypothetical protein
MGKRLVKIARLDLRELAAVPTTKVEVDAHGMKIHLLVSSLQEKIK